METLITILIVYILVPPRTSPPLQSVLFFTFFPILGAFLMILFIWIREKKNYTSLNKRFHQKTIEIGEEGIRYGSADSKGFFRWSDIRKEAFPKESILLFISTNQALLIPRRFFTSAEEEADCISFIKDHLHTERIINKRRINRWQRK